MRIRRSGVISLEKLIWKERVRNKTNRKLTIGTFIFLVSFFVLFYVYQSQYPFLQKQFRLIGNVISEFGGEPTKPPVAQINVDFNDEVGIIRSDFYG